LFVYLNKQTRPTIPSSLSFIYANEFSFMYVRLCLVIILQ